MRNAEDARRHAERWCALLFGDLSAEEEIRFEAELLADGDACAELYRELNLDACLDALEPERVPTQGDRSGRKSAWPRLAVAVGLTFTVGALAWILGSSGTPSLPQQEHVCRPLEPRGTVRGTPARFVWTRQDKAARYRLMVESAVDGRLVHQAIVADTLYVLPGRLGENFAPGGRWKWHVEPLGRSGEDLGHSDVASFDRGG